LAPPRPGFTLTGVARLDTSLPRRSGSSFAAPDPGARAHWQPAVDVCRDRRKWLIKLELAGVRPEDVKVSTRGRVLTVSGVRRDSSVTEGRTFYSMEISYNRFERSIELPFDLDRSEIRTEYRDGMFLLEILGAANDSNF
jgi:HSP20 family protein